MEVGLNEIVGSLLLHHKLWTGCLCPQLLSPPPLHHLLGDLLHPLQLQLGFAGHAADLCMKNNKYNTGFTELGLKKTVEVSSWSFPTDSDPREKYNQSFWRDGKDVTMVIKDGCQVVDDPSDIKTHPMITAPGFSLRLTVVPNKGGPYSCG